MLDSDFFSTFDGGSKPDIYNSSFYLRFSINGGLQKGAEGREMFT